MSIANLNNMPMMGRLRKWDLPGLVSTVLLLLLVGGCERDLGHEQINLSERIKDEELPQLSPDKSPGVLLFGFDLRNNPQEDARQYLPFLKYLEKSTGYQIELRFSPKESRIVDDLGTGAVQFAAIWAGSYIESHAKYV